MHNENFCAETSIQGVSEQKTKTTLFSYLQYVLLTLNLGLLIAYLVL